MPDGDSNQPVRCAIYTRKSSEEGLDKEFNSLDAQREAAEAYIRSQQAEGWIALAETYGDGGFTGANMDPNSPLTAIRFLWIAVLTIFFFALFPIANSIRVSKSPPSTSGNSRASSHRSASTRT
jgi:hypothetical protein